jgi:hypothetical protein
MKELKMNIECQSCKGTGIYHGIGEGDGVGVICYTCYGTGCEEFCLEYMPFTKRKKRTDIKRVHKNGTQWKLGLGKIKFNISNNEICEIDMNKEGVSYKEFLTGKTPKEIKQLQCPMLADQGACSNKEGFKDKCYELGLSVCGMITQCKNYENRLECWKRFECKKINPDS